MAYFPNGSSGEIFEQQCDDCPLGYGWDGQSDKLKPCPVALVQLVYNYEQCDDGQEPLKEAMTLLVNDDGICQVRKLLVECRKEELVK